MAAASLRSHKLLQHEERQHAGQRPEPHVEVRHRVRVREPVVVALVVVIMVVTVAGALGQRVGQQVQQRVAQEPPAAKLRNTRSSGCCFSWLPTPSGTTSSTSTGAAPTKAVANSAWPHTIGRTFRPWAARRQQSSDD